MIGTASKSKITSDLSSKANLLSFHVWFAVARILYQGFQAKADRKRCLATGKVKSLLVGYSETAPTRIQSSH